MILKIIDEELPDYDQIHSVMAKAGMPLMPRDIGISVEDSVNAFIGSRDVRNKYMTCTLLWDLGLTDEYAEKLKEFVTA